MNFPDSLPPAAWFWSGRGLFVPVLLWAARTAPWHRLRDVGQLNLWLGASVMTLMFGPQLALLGLTIVLTAVTLAGMSGWQGFGWNALLMGALPVAISHGIYRLADRKLPNHLFVYIFLNAFLGGALAMAATGLGATLLLQLAGAYPAGYLYHDYLPYFILMAWSEAVSTGMALTLMVVYQPQWVSTFDDTRYLHRK